MIIALPGQTRLRNRGQTVPIRAKAKDIPEALLHLKISIIFV
jgi:hypothetical protein